MWHPKQVRRVERLERLEKTNEEKYCHAELVMLGMLERKTGYDLESQKESCQRGASCKKDSVEEVSCWCGKFVKGELYRPQAIESTESAKAVKEH